MSKIFCAIDNDNEILEGSMGFFEKSYLEGRFPDASVVCLEESSIPQGFNQKHFTVKEEGGTYLLEKKSSEAISILESEDLANRRSQELTALLAIDAETEPKEILKTVILFLQKAFG